jgi:preprotein translocase subunit YajC
MNPVKLYPLMGTPAGAEGQSGGPGAMITTLIPFALIFVIMYFFMIRPQNKKQKETQAMLNALKKGDRIVTVGGLHGTIQRVNDQTVLVKVDENTKLEFARSAISQVIAQGRAEKSVKDDEDDKPAQIEEKKAEDGEKAGE